MNKLVIIGASGHGKVVATIAVECGYNDIVFLDDDSSKSVCNGFPIIGNSDTVFSMDKTEVDVFVAIGNAAIRKGLMKSLD